MADSLTPPPLPEWAGWLAGAAGLGIAAWRGWSDWLTGRITRAKLAAEMETAEVIGAKTMEELRKAHLEETALMLKEMRLAIDDTRAQLEEERDNSRAFRSAVLRFVGRISDVMPRMDAAARKEVQSALDELHGDRSWPR